MTNLSTLTAGRTFPDVSRLDWLQALLTDYEENLPGVDPDAEATMLSEVRGLLADLRDGSYAASAMGRRKSARKTEAHRANAERMNAAKTLAPCNCGAGDADAKQHRATCPVWKRAYAKWWRSQR